MCISFFTSYVRFVNMNSYSCYFSLNGLNQFIYSIAFLEKEALVTVMDGKSVGISKR